MVGISKLFGSAIQIFTGMSLTGRTVMTTSAEQAPQALRAQLANGSLAGNWALDPARSTAALLNKSVWGLVTVKGAFGGVEGGGTVSPAGEVTADPRWLGAHRGDHFRHRASHASDGRWRRQN